MTDTSKYLSPLVSCLTCREVKSAKGIFSHFLTTHTEEGKEKLNLARMLSIPKISESAKTNLDNKTIKYDANPSKCIQCNSILTYKMRKNKFCSHTCSAVHSNEIRDINGWSMPASACITISEKISALTLKYSPVSICTVCNKIFKGKNKKSCSKECYHILNVLSGQKGGKASNLVRCKRSKAEIQLYELCKTLDENIKHNSPLIDKWDSDIFLPKYNLAIMWNGPWHYKQMNLSNHDLVKVQNRDKLKIKLFASVNITTLVFEDRYYTPLAAYNEIMKIVGDLGDDPSTFRLSVECSANVS